MFKHQNIKLSIIVAMSKNLVIGQGNKLPWHLPADFAWFKKHTQGKPVVMGRKTFESIGKPLANRTNIVLSRTPFEVEGVMWANCLEQAVKIAIQLSSATEIMLIGGAEVYQHYLNWVDRIYLTEIQAEIAGDSFFPKLNLSEWQIKEDLFRPKDEKNPYDLHFSILDRLRSDSINSE